MRKFGFLNVAEEKIYIEDIPVIVLTPNNGEADMGTIVLYHGWSSGKETQRIRGFILASVGYRVAIPDAINHGERNPFEDYGFERGDDLWTTVFNNMKEWNLLISGLDKKYGINRDKLGVIGNSMGGITAAGIYTQNEYIKALVVLNGSMAWKNTNDIIKDVVHIPMTEKLKRIESKIEEIDPIENTGKLIDRPILLLHGDSDEVVPVVSQRIFFEYINPKYKDQDKIKFIEYPGLNHLVTTNMMEDSIVFFNKYI